MNGRRGEVLRIAATMTAVCALAGGLLGGAFLLTHRYREAAQRRAERSAILELLQLDSAATVLEIRQFLAPGVRHVVYRAAPFGEAAVREVVFALDGRLVAAGPPASGAGAAGTAAPPEGAGAAASAGRAAPGAHADRDLVPLGRLFVARRAGAEAGFVIEGEARGYKNRIRFFVALTPGFEIAGVRVVEHEEDPGLGAEIATPSFRGQYLGRAARDLAALAVTRDPMPEDWRAALASLGRLQTADWRERHAALLARERRRPIYAVTGATISSRALTDGVRETVGRFQRRWGLLAPQFGGRS